MLTITDMIVTFIIVMEEGGGPPGVRKMTITLH